MTAVINFPFPRSGDHVSRWSVTYKRYEYFIVASISLGDTPRWTFHHVFSPAGKFDRTEREMLEDIYPIAICTNEEAFFLKQGRRPYDYHKDDMVKPPGARYPMRYKDAAEHKTDPTSISPVYLVHDEPPKPRFLDRMEKEGIVHHESPQAALRKRVVADAPKKEYQETMRSLCEQIVFHYNAMHQRELINNFQIAQVLAARLDDTYLPYLIKEIGEEIH